MMMKTDKKHKAQRFGLWGEGVAVFWLRLKGYRIIARNQRIGGAEIDIIAKQRKTLCFIEVKTRPRQSEALHALTIAQQKRLIVAAEAFLCANRRYAGLDIRFDLIAITPKGWPLHLENAWCDER